MQASACSRNYACYGNGGDLEAHKQLVKDLYLTDGLPLRAVMEILRDSHGVNASLNMYKKKFRQWKIRKSANSHEMIVLIGSNSNRENSRTGLKVRGQTLPGLEVQKYPGWPDMRSPNAPNSSAIDPRVDHPPTYSGAQSMLTTIDEYDAGSSRSSSAKISASTLDEEEREPLDLQAKNSHIVIRDAGRRPIKREPGLPSRSITRDRVGSNAASQGRFLNALSNQLELQALHSINSPAVFRMSEELFFAIRTYITPRIQVRLLPQSLDVRDRRPSKTTPLSQRSILPFPEVAHDFSISVFTGLTSFTEVGTSSAVASLERAFRLIKDLLRQDWFYDSIGIFLEAVILTQVHGAPQVGRMMLRQIAHMATILWGSKHACAVWARNLLMLLDLNGVLETVTANMVDTIEDILGADDLVVVNQRAMQYDLEFKLRKHGNPSEDPSEHIAKYEALLKMCLEKGDRKHLRLHMNITAGLAGIYENIGAYDKAVATYSNAPTQLARAMADLAEQPDEEPFFVPLNCIRSVTALGKALFHQGKFEEASRVFDQSLSAALQVLEPDHQTTIWTIAEFGKCLASLNLDEDARAMYEAVDERLAPYMLKLEDQG